MVIDSEKVYGMVFSEVSFATGKCSLVKVPNYWLESLKWLSRM